MAILALRALSEGLEAEMIMQTLKVLSELLCYPEREFIEHLPEMGVALDEEGALAEPDRTRLKAWMAELGQSELLALQADYVALFDRGRALSLHLFEHVHGESRSRGQAMVDLMNLYQSHGLKVSARELPDFIPLFLEYLSRRPAEEACELLGEAVPIFSLLKARLAKRHSAYALVFAALESLAGRPEEDKEIRARVTAEPPDDTFEALDRAWGEEPVSFGPGAACVPTRASAQTVRWVPREKGPVS